MKEKSQNLLGKIKKFVKKRKILSGIILLILIFAIYKIFFAGSAAAETTYNIDTVSKQTVVSSISETGQVSVDGSVDVKSSVSGKITSIKVKAGDYVKAGQLIATIDTSDIYTSLAQAKLSYENAQLNYQKATGPSATTSIISAQISLQNLQNNLAKSYNDTFTEITNTYTDMSNIISSLHDAIYTSTIDSLKEDIYFYKDNAAIIERDYKLDDESTDYTNKAFTLYTKIKNDYDIAFANYKNLSSSSASGTIYAEAGKAIDLSKELSSALKNYTDFVQYYQDLSVKYGYTVNPKTTTYLTDFRSYQNTVNGHISSLTSDKNNIDSTNLSIQQQNINVDQVENGATGLDLQSAEIAFAQAKLNYDSAMNNYNNYFITAPISGQISSVSAFVGQDSGTIATIITKGKFADLSVSEVDIPKIKLEQKATLTFDAIEDLSIVGTVSEISQTGSVSSGVVSYTVKVAFPDDDNQVKAGMSVTANIITGVATDVLAVPSSAVKSNVSGSYVEVFPSVNSLTEVGNGSYTSASSTPNKVSVTTGLAGDDYTEILSGLKEGDIVVTKTTSANTSAATASSATRSGGAQNIRGGGVGGFRIGG